MLKIIQIPYVHETWNLDVTQQHHISPAFEHPAPSVTSEENGRRLNMVCRIHGDKMKRMYR